MLKSRMVAMVVPCVTLLFLVTGCRQWMQSALHRPLTAVGSAGSTNHQGDVGISTHSGEGTSRKSSPSGDSSPSSEATGRGKATSVSHLPAGNSTGNSPTPTSLPDATSAFQALGNVGPSKQTWAPGQSRQGLQSALTKTQLKASEAQLVKPYVTTLNGLQARYVQSLYGLYDAAKAEYHVGNKSKTSIENKYLPKVMNLQNSAQDELNRLLFALKDKLQTAGYSTAPVDALRSTYYAEIAQMQAKLGH